jgi:hypothetical protein
MGDLGIGIPRISLRHCLFCRVGWVRLIFFWIGWGRSFTNWQWGIMMSLIALTLGAFRIMLASGLARGQRADPCHQPLNNLHLHQIALRPDIACVSSELGCGAAFSSEERGSVQQEAPAPRCFTADASRGFVSGIFEVTGARANHALAGGMTEPRNVMSGRRIVRSVTRGSITASVRVRLRVGLWNDRRLPRV